MKDLLNFVEGMYKYAFSIKDNGSEVHISPAILSNDYTKLNILPTINIDTPISEVEDIAKTFTEDILKNHFFKANSKLDFLNEIRTKNIINYIDDNEFIIFLVLISFKK